MDIKVNIAILSRKMGDIIRENDADYNTFKMWAKNRDRKMGVIICEFITDSKDAPEIVVPDKMSTQHSEDATEESINEDSDIEKIFKCDKCDYITKSSKALHMHKLGKHKEDNYA